MADSFDPAACRIALLSGGVSGEREISLASGEGVRRALEESGFSVEVFDPAKKSDLKALVDGDFDAAFICLHGKMGEDGVIQGFLEAIGLPYTGPGVWASATAMNKAASKMVYRAAGVPTLPSFELKSRDEVKVPDILAELGEKCVVKAASEGSSIGVYIVEGAQALEEAVSQAFDLGSEVVVERYAKGREFTAAVLGTSDPHPLPLVEIEASNEFYDFESKYATGGSVHTCPANIPEDVSVKIQGYAALAHNALGCRGVSRTDFILDEEGNAWALETNTIPGMTSTSLLPDAARAAGISYPELCTLLVKYALEER